MSDVMQEIARGLGAQIVGEIPDVGGGYSALPDWLESTKPEWKNCGDMTRRLMARRP